MGEDGWEEQDAEEGKKREFTRERMSRRQEME